DRVAPRTRLPAAVRAGRISRPRRRADSCGRRAAVGSGHSRVVPARPGLARHYVCGHGHARGVARSRPDVLTPAVWTPAVWTPAVWTPVARGLQTPGSTRQPS